MSQINLVAGKKQARETTKAIQACNDYLRMGPGRSLSKLLRKWEDLGEKEPNFEPPTQSQGTLESWSSKYEWVERAKVYDAAEEEKKNKERERVMQSGLALDYERVKKLVTMYNETYVNLKESTDRQDQARFLNVLRGILDDLAKETGGRVAKQQVNNEGNLNINIEYVNDWRNPSQD